MSVHVRILTEEGVNPALLRQKDLGVCAVGAAVRENLLLTGGKALNSHAEVSREKYDEAAAIKAMFLIVG